MLPQKPSLDLSFPCRRELFLSFLSAIILVVGVLSVLALVTAQIANLWEEREDAQPILVNQVESEKEPVEEEPVFTPSPAISRAPSAVTPPAQLALETPAMVDAPEAKEPLMDDLAWSQESIEPWVEEKKTEMVKPPKPQPVVVRKSAPSKPKPRPAPVVQVKKKPATYKATPARVISRANPSYSRKARRKGMEGRVVVTVTIAVSGRVSSGRVSSSSGHASLDSAALKAAKKYRFSPAKNTRGQAISSQVSLPFNFKLT